LARSHWWRRRKAAFPDHPPTTKKCRYYITTLHIPATALPRAGRNGRHLLTSSQYSPLNFRSPPVQTFSPFLIFLRFALDMRRHVRLGVRRLEKILVNVCQQPNQAQIPSYEETIQWKQAQPCNYHSLTPRRSCPYRGHRRHVRFAHGVYSPLQKHRNWVGKPQAWPLAH